MANLIRAATLPDTFQNEKQQQEWVIQNLRQEIEENRIGYENRLRSLRQEHERIKTQYETKINSLIHPQKSSSSSSSSSSNSTQNGGVYSHYTGGPSDLGFGRYSNPPIKPDKSTPGEVSTTVTTPVPLSTLNIKTIGQAFNRIR